MRVISGFLAHISGKNLTKRVGLSWVSSELVTKSPRNEFIVNFERMWIYTLIDCLIMWKRYVLEIPLSCDNFTSLRGTVQRISWWPPTFIKHISTPWT
jgi:hypothetical protein